MSVPNTPTILANSSMHPHCLVRLRQDFDLVIIPKAIPSEITEDLARRVVGFAAMMAPINAEFIDALPNLQIIANYGVGYDAIDVAYAAKRGVVVTNTPDVLSDEVADTAIALLLNTAKELPKAEAWLRAGNWAKSPVSPVSKASLRGRKVGIFGMGRIGQAIARRAEAFGMPVAYHNRRPVDGVSYTYHPTLLSLAQSVDTLISAAPGNAGTEKAVTMEVLQALGPDGIFVNVGRGSTVDEDALIRALADGVILGAGLDVFATEPRVPQSLLDLPNAVLLPHIGSATLQTRQAMADLVVDNMVSWFAGRGPLTPVPGTARPA